MDPSVHFLIGNGAAEPDGATIHSIAPPPPALGDDDGKIAFTLDVAMRLDREPPADDTPQAVIVPMTEEPPEELADSA